MDKHKIISTKCRLKKPISKPVQHSTIDIGTWVKLDDAIALVYPSIIKDLNNSIILMNSDKIDKATSSLGTTIYYTPSILSYIKEYNKELFLKTKNPRDKKEFDGERLTRNNKDLRVVSPRIFNTISKFKGNRDFDIRFKGNEMTQLNVYDTYKLHYGLLMFHNFLTKYFIRWKGIKKYQLNFLLYAKNYVYWTRGDAYTFYLGAYRPLNSLTNELIELNLIEKAKFHRKFTNTVYRLTPKGNELLDDYMDVIMFKKKLPITEESRTKSFTKYALSEKKNKLKTLYFRAYALYSYMFEYINKNDIDNPLGYRQDEIDLARGEYSKDYKFSSFMYLTLNELYKKGKVKPITIKMIKNFLAKDIFADSGYKFVYNDKKKRKELVEPRNKNFQERDALNDMFEQGEDVDDDLFTN